MDECLKFKKEALEELGIDEGVYDELLRCFIPEAEDELQKLDDAIRAGNFTKIAELGHGLKGMAGNLRVYPMQVNAKAIELCAKAGLDMQAISNNAAEMKEYLAGLKQWIK